MLIHSWFTESRLKGVSEKGQTAIEYLLLLGMVVAIVLVALQTYMSQVEESSEGYLNVVAVGIMGDPPPNFVAF